MDKIDKRDNAEIEWERNASRTTIGIDVIPW